MVGMDVGGTMPLVSIVTPTLNPGWRLSRCCRSIQQQTYPRIEHIVVDGGSTDETPQWLNESSDLVWLSEPDEGQSDAINKGFNLANGRFFGWLNADDELTPEATEFAVSRLLSRPGVGWVYGNNLIVKGRHSTLLRPPKRLVEGRFSDGNPVPQAGSLIERSLWASLQGLVPSFNLMMDMDLWLRVLESNYAHEYINNTLAIVEVHSASKSGSISIEEHLEECVRIWLGRNRPDFAAVVLGRILAHRAVSDGAIDSVFLRHLLNVNAALSRDRLPCRMVEAGAFLESTRIEYNRGPRRLTHLLRAAPWLCSTTRRHLLHGFARKITRKRFPRYV